MVLISVCPGEARCKILKIAVCPDDPNLIMWDLHCRMRFPQDWITSGAGNEQRKAIPTHLNKGVAE